MRNMGWAGFAASMLIFTADDIPIVRSEYMLIDDISSTQNRGSYFGAHSISTIDSFVWQTLGILGACDVSSVRPSSRPPVCSSLQPGYEYLLQILELRRAPRECGILFRRRRARSPLAPIQIDTKISSSDERPSQPRPILSQALTSNAIHRGPLTVSYFNILVRGRHRFVSIQRMSIAPWHDHESCGLAAPTQSGDL